MRNILFAEKTYTVFHWGGGHRASLAKWWGLKSTNFCCRLLNRKAKSFGENLSIEFIQKKFIKGHPFSDSKTNFLAVETGRNSLRLKLFMVAKFKYILAMDYLEFGKLRLNFCKGIRPFCKWSKVRILFYSKTSSS